MIEYLKSKGLRYVEDSPNEDQFTLISSSITGDGEQSTINSVSFSKTEVYQVVLSSRSFLNDWVEKNLNDFKKYAYTLNVDAEKTEKGFNLTITFQYESGGCPNAE